MPVYFQSFSRPLQLLTQDLCRFLFSSRHECWVQRVEETGRFRLCCATLFTFSFGASRDALEIDRPHQPSHDVQLFSKLLWASVMRKSLAVKCRCSLN